MFLKEVENSSMRFNDRIFFTPVQFEAALERAATRSDFPTIMRVLEDFFANASDDTLAREFDAAAVHFEQCKNKPTQQGYDETCEWFAKLFAKYKPMSSTSNRSRKRSRKRSRRI